MLRAQAEVRPAAEVGRSVGKEEFEAEEPKLRLELLEAQRALQKAGVPVIVLFAGATMGQLLSLPMILVGAWLMALLGLVLWVIDAGLIWFGRRTFRRSKLATQI